MSTKFNYESSSSFIFIIFQRPILNVSLNCKLKRRTFTLNKLCLKSVTSYGLIKTLLTNSAPKLQVKHLFENCPYQASELSLRNCEMYTETLVENSSDLIFLQKSTINFLISSNKLSNLH